MFDKTKEEVKEVENILKGYRDLLIDIDITELRIAEVEEEYRGCEGIEYRETTGATNKFNSTVENEVMNKEQRLVGLKNKLDRLKREKRRIDRAVNSLEGVDKVVIELRYINKRSVGWKSVANSIGYCENHCMKRIKPRALECMIKFLLY
ncbi:hypothetical protein P3F01_15885 [Clostridium perfringens]|uniref:hypothetical protein n=1 Tax=Clostridium perfringens TaxID=1502 RepID=UPI0028E153CE|nr:hypothetical protein [Clostridium perfringens]MDT9337840.1 hypothetical protein [Clostridium perfringens]MDT9345597.1 hypothetical protein [Clostridium perfringens]MDT9346993.1 hypothetical protein [Clostridium perfringens]MDT9354683.1 hypothetical protein [Clostridium perfringens]